MDVLDELEQRVGEKWATAAAARLTPLPGPFDFTDWTDWATIEPDALTTVPQFPREQWASYPARRTVTLMICDRMLDFDELTDEQWAQVCLLMQYGGKTRLT